MCGIAGILSFGERLTDTTRIKRMTDAIAHRGPDGHGQWISPDCAVGLGHRRLSIIDLTNLAAQPMSYLDRYTITFNGEIYNYLELRKILSANGFGFKSSSDTEVLLAMYHWKGQSMMNDLDGMFSFAIWDNVSKKMFCARDRYGEKPFFFCLRQDGFYFASEMKALFAIGVKCEPDNSMIANYIFNDLVLDPNDETKTFYMSIKKLAKGTFLEIDQRGKVKVERYYSINRKESTVSPEDAVLKFQSLLIKSVQQTMRSDVKVGSSLSGGLDSSTLVYLINQQLKSAGKENQNTTFSARFEEVGFSESEYLDCILDDLKIENHSVYPDAALIHQELKHVFYHQEEPFLSTSILNQWSVMRLANQHGVTVLLDGQGADELLGGYPWHYKIYLMELYKSSKAAFNDELEGRSKNGFLNSSLNFADRIKVNYRSGVDFASKLKQYSFRKWGFQGLSKNALWYGLLNRDFLDLKKINLPRVEPYTACLNDVLEADHRSFLLESLLRYSDRNSMAFSREVRMPYLNHELVDYCFSLTASNKIHHGWQKYILRKAFENKLPSKITWRKDKMGYGAPQDKWLNDPRNSDFINDNWLDLQNRGVIKKNIPLITGAIWKMLMLNSTIQFSKTDF